MSNSYTIVDIHNHHLPEEVIARGGDVGGRNLAWSTTNRAEVYRAIRDAERTLQIMDSAGVDISVLSIAQWSSLGLDAARIVNNRYAEIVKRYPGRFIGCACIPLEPSSDVINELDRAVNDLGISALALVTSTPKFTIGSEELIPIFDKINQLELPVIIHPTINTPIWGGVKYNMSSHISREYEIAKATVEVLYGWLSRYPDLKFMLPHMGGGMSVLKGRINAYYEPEGWEIPVTLKLGGKTPRELAELGLDKAFDKIFDRLYFDMAGFNGWMPAVHSALLTIRTDRLCFGTDYPQDFHCAEDITAYINMIKQLNITEAEKRNMLGENALEFFGICK